MQALIVDWKASGTICSVAGSARSSVLRGHQGCGAAWPATLRRVLWVRLRRLACGTRRCERNSLNAAQRLPLTSAPARVGPGFESLPSKPHNTLGINTRPIACFRVHSGRSKAGKCVVCRDRLVDLLEDIRTAEATAGRMLPADWSAAEPAINDPSVLAALAWLGSLSEESRCGCSSSRQSNASTKRCKI